MRILFIDTAATCFPARGKDAPPWQPHMLRVAAIREDDGEITGRLTALVCPLADWPVDEATQPYHKATIGDLAHNSLLIEQVVDQLGALLDGIDLIVGHHFHFHERVIRAAFADAGAEPPPIWTAFDTMTETADTVQVKLQSQNRWKSPSLAEAYRFFSSGDDLPIFDDWQRHAEQQVDAVRAVYQGYQRHQRLDALRTRPVAPVEG